ncbi:MAG: metallophosphoesterase [Candidatus Magasanikbacteria bacterium]|nr:metallophosphoesterase [Candidatus Magasanikbacteria bacterium]
MYLAQLYDIFLVFYIGASFISAILLIKKKRAIVFAWLLLLSSFGITYSAYVEPYWVKVRIQPIVLNKTKEPLRVAVMGDWHIRPGKGATFIKREVQKIAGLKPDLIVMTGDFLFFDDFDEFVGDLRALTALSKIAPTITVLGNHDYGIGDPAHGFDYTDSHREISKIFSDGGIKVLADSYERIKIKGINIEIAGFDESWLKFKNRKNIIDGFDPSTDLKIAVSHNPDAAFENIASKFDLMITAHTHGGQVRLPFIGALVEAGTMLPKKDYGKYIADHTPPIFNTIGIGESGPHLRFWDRPEIAILDIK